MTLRYSHLTPSHKLKAVDMLAINDVRENQLYKNYTVNYKQSVLSHVFQL